MIIENVLKGEDDWLFLFQGAHYQFDYLMGKKTVSKRSIINFNQNIKERQSFCDSKKIIYKHIIFPSKPLVKKEYLPRDYKTSIRSLFYRSYKNTLDINTNNSILYLLEFLKKEEMDYSTFLKYDTHMSDKSYLAISNLLLDTVGLNPISSDDYSFKTKVFQGDLFKMLNYKKIHKEEFFTFTRNIYKTYSIGNRGFLKGNSNEVYITHSFKKKSSKKLLIFGDSFFKDIIKILKPYFRDILYVRSRNMEYDIIELYQPDIVFTGNSERYLSKVDADNKRDSFLWKLYGRDTYSPSMEYIKAFSANLSYKYNIYQYLKWVEEIEKRSRYSLDLENYQINKNIELMKSNHYLRFKSINSDPYITYFNIDFKVGKKYILTVFLYSLINTVFQIFYTDNRIKENNFSEKRSLKRSIFKGYNTLYILLDFPFLGDTMRIDPMNAVGEMEILKMKLEEL
jgi:hypothetical protein